MAEEMVGGRATLDALPQSCVHPRFSKLITSLRTTVEKGEGQPGK